MTRASIFLALMLSLGALGAPSTMAGDLGRYGSDQPLSAAEAFPMSVMTGRDGQVLVRWEMPPGYYIYRDKLEFASRGGLTIKRVNIPHGLLKLDPLVGSVQIYRDSITIVVEPLKTGMAGELLVKFQGCAEDKLCYPPMTRVFKLPG